MPTHRNAIIYINKIGSGREKLRFQHAIKITITIHLSSVPQESEKKKQHIRNDSA